MSSPCPVPLKSLASLIQTPEYARQALGLIEQIHCVKDAFALVEMLRTATLALGAENSVYVHAVPHEKDGTILRVMMACDPLWAYTSSSEYNLDGDPLLQYARDHSEVVLVSELAGWPGILDDKPSSAERLGCGSGALFPTQCGGGTGRFGVLLLGATAPGWFEAEETHLFRVLAHALSVQLHAWWMKETRTQLLETAHLTADDLRLLAWERDGRCTKQIAAKLGVSRSAVNSRFQRINSKLACPNRRLAALRAATHGLL